MTPELRDAYSFFLSEKGKVLLEHWANKFSFSNRTTVVANDPITTAFNEGQRVVWCFIVREIMQSREEDNRPASAVTSEGVTNE